jgi:methyl-accepting chemotaxis protein
LGAILTLPKLSIAAKLYVIFALMAATTLALSSVAVRGARSHADLTDDFQSANGGSLNVERISGLVYAATAEMHAITRQAKFPRRRRCAVADAS